MCITGNQITINCISPSSIVCIVGVYRIKFCIFSVIGSIFKINKQIAKFNNYLYKKETWWIFFQPKTVAHTRFEI